MVIYMFRKNLLHDSFFDDINGHSLDKYQRKVILNNTKHLLVVAGAGSGKTLTIVGKIKYLIEKERIDPSLILCLSYTNETVNNLKDKVNYNVDVLTFHKLALQILKENAFKYAISDDSLLEYVTNEYFESYLVNREYLKEYLVDNNKLDYLKRNIISFIKNIKCNNIDLFKLKKIIKRKTNNKIFLIFALSIYRIYKEELLSTSKIDFDDMINYAKYLIKNNGKVKRYKYIIIDEYQDISVIRFEMIREILKVTNANLMCVGDDYQSIYGFSGSNVRLFVDFSKYFPNSQRMDIKNTYRNCYQLIKTSIKFIMKNPYQLKKNIYAQFLLKYPIVLVYYDDLGKSYDNLINYLYLENKKNILTLARYNNDLSIVKKQNKGMNIKYLTVHMAKGLECDNVILLKMSDEYLGFPSKIENSYTFFNNEEIDYAEERRLFYVALTRTKERIYILVPKDNPSRFIEEIKFDCVELLIN